MPIALKLGSFLSQTSFTRWKDAVRKIASWNPAEKVWEISPYKLYRLPLWMALDVYLTLQSFDTTVKLPDGSEAEPDVLWNIFFPSEGAGRWDSLPEFVSWKPPFFQLPLTEEQIGEVLKYMNDSYLPPSKKLASDSCSTAVYFSGLEVRRTKALCSYSAGDVSDVAVAYVLKGKIAELLKVADAGNPYEVVWRLEWADEFPDPQAYVKESLKPYLRDAVLKSIETLGLRGGGVLKVSSVGDKLTVVDALIKELTALGMVKRALILSPSKSSLLYARDALEMMSGGEYPAEVFSDKAPSEGVVLMSSQLAVKAVISSVFGSSENTVLSEALKVLKGSDLVILDSAEKVSYLVLRTVISYASSKPVLGLATTLWREDGLEPYLYGFVGPLAFSADSWERKAVPEFNKI